MKSFLMRFSVMRRHILAIICAFSVILCCHSETGNVSSQNSKELRLLGLLPMTGDGWSGGTACLPATQMAVEDVNANENILKGYKLVYNWIDSKCDPGTTVYRMFQVLNKDQPYVMILGAGCSVASEATAQVTHLWNLTQFSYASSSPILSNRKRFPRFFRLALPDQKLNAARIDLMKEFNWKKVATINQALEFFSALDTLDGFQIIRDRTLNDKNIANMDKGTGVVDDFVRRAQDEDITIISQEIFVTDPYARVKNLKQRDARIIMTALYENMAREVLCAAYKVGLYGPKIVWVFVGWFSTTFWKSNLDDVDCTEEEMDKAAEGAFITGPVFANPVEERGVANMTASEFEARYFSYPTYDVISRSYDFYAHQCYDHVWVAAKALDCTVTRLEELGFSKSLDRFTYNDSGINDVIFECLGHTSLTGVSGRVVFTTSADPNRIVKMERIQNGERQKIGLHRLDKDPNYFEWIEGAIKWKDDIIPRDSTEITNVEIKISVYLYGTMTGLAGLGLCLTIFLFVFNVFHRNNRFVKLSSPNINNIFLVGCVFCYSTVFLKTAEIENVAVCKIRIFCFSLGFTVTFGALFAKTWRVYRIFTNKQLQKRTIKDYQLFAIIGGMVALILVIVVSWETIGPHKIQIKFLPREVYMMGNDAEVHPYVRVCQSDYSDIFGWVLYISQGVLLMFGAFLAWETRKVQIKALNDSHQIGLCVYNVLVLSAVGLTLSLLLNDQEVLMYGITSGCLILGTTMTQMIIFIPKIRVMHGKDGGKDISVRTMARENSTISKLNVATLQSPCSQSS